MGSCFSREKRVSDTESELLVTVAFSDMAPVSVAVRGSGTLGQVRDKVRAHMARRATKGMRTAPVAGVVMTMRGNGGDAVQLSDTATIRGARLELKQYIWFHDQREEDRVRAVVLRASRLTDDVAKNSRGGHASRFRGGKKELYCGCTLTRLGTTRASLFARLRCTQVRGY